ncbi:hypothetical protein C8Q74DRAFT_1362940 [Fomes fomentarius]|nr:hypothetical protein C8Q74DRAFT_1362940 [Fomes fomentarius]
MLAVLIGMGVGGTIQCLTAVLTSKSPLATTTPLGFKYSGCNLSLTYHQGVHLALAWSAMLWFDTIIFLLTFYKAIKVRREMPGGLLVTIFRDGTIYYAILVAINMVNIISFVATRSTSPLKGTPTTMTNVLSVTLTSRLMLNLRDPNIQPGRRVDARYEGWSIGQVSSRMMSFQTPPVFTESYELGECTASESSVRS